MFRCDECKTNQDSCKSPTRVVTHIRKRSYFIAEDKESFGTEIVKEIDVCQNCANKRVAAGFVPTVVAEKAKQKIVHLADDGAM